MSSARLQELVGTFSGTNHLWLDPEDPAELSASTAEVTLSARGQFLSIAYTWSKDENVQQGVVLLSTLDEARETGSVWIDSWHMKNQIMVCEKSAFEGGVVRLSGSYAAPPGPDWGWRIEIEVQSADTWMFRMFNLWPEGREDRAVAVEYSRT
ncbi:MAG: DUF1579 family protein [Candidatus Eisenbacteria bacterium]|uniref:DUF1579 family protein n=1 Tax=Eiseniibacteriota bacterium TaxID=2212470 RepID=A0A956NL22_UNCEI|nr:DUF1579 family protein [Candidatus Eisenbacteria bacterium]MCB9464178.1 DUF1579 family protein [Candidatus Eisenbacteria bacterium]